MNRNLFQKLALERLDDAQALLSAKRYSGAYYLAGYGLECALKACIARRTKRHAFPPRDASKYYVHDLEKLLDAAELRKELDQERKSQPDFDNNWTLVKDWNEEARYQNHSRVEARDLLAAILDSNSGVLQWLRKHW